MATTIDQWNAEINYGPPFLSPEDSPTAGIYMTDAWSHSNKRWLTGLFVYANNAGTAIAGLDLFYDDGTNSTTHSLGHCQAADDCQAIGAVWSLSGPPNVHNPADMELGEVLKRNFLEKVTVHHTEAGIVGLTFHGNAKEPETLMVPNHAPAKVRDTILQPGVARGDQIVLGFYGSYRLNPKDSTDGALKDLGIIAGSFETYAKSWVDEWTSASGSIEQIRESGQTVGPFGPTPSPSRTDPDYFESVTATDPTKRHWISSIELYSGGGFDNFSIIGTHSILSRTNDILGMRIQHSFMNALGEKQSQVLNIGWDQFQRPTKKKVITFGTFEYLEAINYKTIQDDFEISSDNHQQWWFATKGVSSVQLVIGSLISDTPRIITWDPSVVGEASHSNLPYKTQHDWRPLDPEQAGRAIIGLYGTSLRIANPQHRQDKDTKAPGITNLGAIYAPIGCALRNKPFGDDDILRIKAHGKVAFEIVDGLELPVCGRVP